MVFGDTACGSPCAAALSALAGLSRRLQGTAKTPQVLFVSFAPERDTPAALAAHLARYDARFVGATGPRPTLKLLAEELAPALAAEGPAARGRRPPYPGSLLLVGPDGALRAEFLPPFDVPRTTQSYLKLRLRG